MRKLSEKIFAKAFLVYKNLDLFNCDFIDEHYCIDRCYLLYYA